MKQGPNLEEAREEAIKQFEKTKEYFDLELKIIEMETGLDLTYKFLNQFKDRAKNFILGIKKEPYNTCVYDDLPEYLKEEGLTKRTLYLSKVNDELIKRSKLEKYFPVNGSVWEDIGKRLEELANEIKEDIRYQIK
ncbi:MAG: hypothetical protein WCT51_04485 [Candidatus Shapirobacteria bacterium]|jgi:hypothetical protein